MRRPISWAAAVTALLPTTVSAQTYSSCNPTQRTGCPADTALGMSIAVDFTQGSVNSFTSAGGGTVKYTSSGAEFTVAQSGDAPQLNSAFYIMFGRVEITMKAAPGTGIVSSLVLQSDDLDEIDMEWLGADASTVQTNYFGRGDSSPGGRGAVNPAADNQASFVRYTVDWTSDRIAWYVGGTLVRTLAAADAAAGLYPQTPMQVKLGAWSAGDPANAPGTVSWAGGSTDYAQGPFTMTVRSVAVTDYSTGSAYRYGDTSGSWESITADGGGKVNGNLGAASASGAGAGAATATAAATGPAATVPTGGIGGGSAAATAAAVASIPSGWHMTSEGKIVPDAAGSAPRPPRLLLAAAPLAAVAVAACWLA